MTKLNVIKRDVKKNLDSIRAEGGIPAVFYGSKSESTPITIDSRDFEKVYNDAGETHTVALNLEGTKEVNVLIHKIQRHPVSNMPVHIDLLVVDMNKPVEVDVPIEFIGVTPTEKDGGIVVKTIHEAKVKALPSAVPEKIVVDISTLVTMEDVIHLKDLKLPAGVTFVDDVEQVVASITKQKEEEETTPTTMEDALASIEVEKKGKEEKPEEEAEA